MMVIHEYLHRLSVHLLFIVMILGVVSFEANAQYSLPEILKLKMDQTDSALQNMNIDKNEIKGRIFPAGYLFSLGIGYERRVKENIGLQILGNYYGRDYRRGDGNFIQNANIVPEIRYYWCENCRNSRLWFVGYFTELVKVNLEYSGERSFSPNIDFPLDYEELQINPGVLLGKKLKLSDLWFLEVYAGAKFRFVKRTTHYILGVNRYSKDINRYDFGSRAGLNISMRF